MKVAFVSDSGTARTVAQLKELGIYSCPLQISSQTNNYLELEDLSIDEVYQILEKGEMLKTSLPPLGLIEEMFAQIKQDGYDTVFCVPICSGLSGTMNAMRLAAQEAGLVFETVDTHVTAEVEFYCITKAKQLIESGMSIEQTKKELQKVIDSASTLLIPVDLDHLKRGGRLTAFAATLAGLLKIKPILKIDKETEGRIDVLAKVRTLPKAIDTAVQFMVEHRVDPSYHIIVAYVLEKEECEKTIEKINEAIPGANAQLIKLISTVGCHTGLGCIAIQYYKGLD